VERRVGTRSVLPFLSVPHSLARPLGHPSSLGPTHSPSPVRSNRMFAGLMSRCTWVGLLWDVSTLWAVVPPPGLYGVVGTGVLWDVSTLWAVVPPPGLYGVVGTGVLWDVSTLCAVVPSPGLYGVVGAGVLWDVSTLWAVVPPPGLYVVMGTGLLWDVSARTTGGRSDSRYCSTSNSCSVSATACSSVGRHPLSTSCCRLAPGARFCAM
jgi:hypothetical protein